MQARLLGLTLGALSALPLGCKKDEQPPPQQPPAYQPYPAQPTAAPVQPAQPVAAQPAQPVAGQPAATAAPAAGAMSTPSPMALACTTDASCLTHRCNTQAGKCAWPCQTPNDCVAGNQCMAGACVPKMQ